MCRKPDSLVSFYLIYVYIYGVLFTYFFDLLFSKTRQHSSNLLFGLIGHFGLLKDVSISFFLFFLLTHSLSHMHYTSAYPNSMRVRFFTQRESKNVKESKAKRLSNLIDKARF